MTSHCARLVPDGAAGVVLVDGADQSRLAAVTRTGTGTSPHAADLFDVSAGAAPGAVATRPGRTITLGDLTAGEPGTGDWCRRAHAAGYRSACAIPMRLRARVIGALTILSTRPGQLPVADRAAATAFADIATIRLLTQEQADRSAALTGQLQLALDTRVVIEQAKGIVAGALNLTVQEAFDLLRDNSRHTNTPLAQLARAITTRTVSFRDLVWPVHPGWDHGL